MTSFSSRFRKSSNVVQPQMSPHLTSTTVLDLKEAIWGFNSIWAFPKTGRNFFQYIYLYCLKQYMYCSLQFIVLYNINNINRCVKPLKKPTFKSYDAPAKWTNVMDSFGHFGEFFFFFFLPFPTSSLLAKKKESTISSFQLAEGIPKITPSRSRQKFNVSTFDLKYGKLWSLKFLRSDLRCFAS